jgi:hypothetical protein
MPIGGELPVNSSEQSLAESALSNRSLVESEPILSNRSLAESADTNASWVLSPAGNTWVSNREGNPKGWSTVLITALGSWEKSVSSGHK